MRRFPVHRPSTRSTTATRLAPAGGAPGGSTSERRLHSLDAAASTFILPTVPITAPRNMPCKQRCQVQQVKHCSG